MFSSIPPVDDGQNKHTGKKETLVFENAEENFPDECSDDGTEYQLLSLSEAPIYFEPISQLTNVFFDRDNQQIFCVRSNGVGGILHEFF